MTMRTPGDIDQDELLRRLQRELIDGYDEELEMEIEDRPWTDPLQPVPADQAEDEAHRLHRHRYFETEGFLCMQPPHTKHRLRGAVHNCHVEDGVARLVAGNFADLASAREAMGIDWMDRQHLAEAIPPAYTEFIGGFLMAAIRQPV